MSNDEKQCAGQQLTPEQAAEAYLQQQMAVKPGMTLEEQDNCKGDFLAGMLQAKNQPTPEQRASVNATSLFVTNANEFGNYVMGLARFERVVQPLLDQLIALQNEKAALEGELGQKEGEALSFAEWTQKSGYQWDDVSWGWNLLEDLRISAASPIMTQVRLYPTEYLYELYSQEVAKRRAS